MKIETKFNVGDKVFILADDELKEGTIEKIQIEISSESLGNPIQPLYVVESSRLTVQRVEDYIFKTKEEVAEYIIGQSTWEKIKNKLFKSH